MDKHLNYYEVRWKNFKGFKDTGWIRIKPITILIGPNNSGKTSFIAPFLLMQQTLTSRDGITPIITKGDLYDGGSIQELINDYSLRKDIEFGIRYHVHETNEKLGLIGSAPPGGFDVTIGLNKKDKNELIIKSEKFLDRYRREFFSLTLGPNSKYSLRGPINTKNMSIEEIKAIRALTSDSAFNFLFNAESLLTTIFEQQGDKEKRLSRKRGFTKDFTTVLDILSYNYSRVRRYIGGLSYIGPIREKPHRVYEVSNENYNTVGPQGENMTNLLKKHFSKRNKEIDGWIKRFGFGDWLELKKLYGNSYSIRFRQESTDLYTSIANAGFGASQILPLIVQGLVSPRGSLTIAEQPEIHLNPTLQCELADLFVFMAKKNQKVIVETHSEHLLLRLRKLVAERTIASDDIAIYFVEKKKNVSRIREIKVQRDGHINDADWPSDFFVDSLRESLALATAQYKSSKRNN